MECAVWARFIPDDDRNKELEPAGIADWTSHFCRPVLIQTEDER